MVKLEANRESEEIRKLTTDMLQKINLEAVQSEEAKQVAKDKLILEKTCWINHIRNAELKNRKKFSPLSETKASSCQPLPSDTEGLLPDKHSRNSH